MSQRRLPDLAQLPNRARQWLEEVRADLRAGLRGFREDPAALFHSPIFRIGVYIVLAVVALLIVRWLVASLVPRDAAEAQRGNTYAEIHVACTSQACLQVQQVQVDLHFKAWPMRCAKCGQASVYRAQRCRRCQQWFATAPGTATECPRCAERERARQKSAKPSSRPVHRDDAEDGWE